MSETLKLSILSPERRLVQSVIVDEVTLPGSEGQIQVLPGHSPMIGTLVTGAFQYRSPNKGTVVGVLTTGFFEVKHDEIHVLAETLELKGEIDLDRARRAQQLAEETLKGASLDEQQFNKYQLKLQRALIRQQIAGQAPGAGH
jgi:F-type H+-transporting ATPase subunit epsilon